MINTTNENNNAVMKQKQDLEFDFAMCHHCYSCCC